VVEQLVVAAERRRPHRRDPDLDPQRLCVVLDGAPVVDVVRVDDEAAAHPGLLVVRGVLEEEVHPRHLEVAEERDVVDVLVGVHVGPAHRDVHGVSHAPTLPYRRRRAAGHPGP
jgi:hypothetical protein